MTHGMHEHIDTQAVTVRRKLIEESWVVRLSLPGVSNVCVVGHDDQKTPVFVADGSEMRYVAITTPFRCRSSPRPVPELN